jgi:CRISPR/Cas system CSM-associated protein Csm2 small subunit
MSDPWRNYDAWLTTDRAAEAQERAWDLMHDAWEAVAEALDLPVDAADDEHPEHALFEAFVTFYTATDAYHMRLEAEAEAEMYRGLEGDDE